ncbi:MAG: rhomboid family intramembrane serine protease [Bacteroidales bacterium]|nr:rhomboid family intramembrane serine protease [Bacteroidales bacterium]
MNADERRMLKSFILPAILVAIMWLVKTAEVVFSFRASFLGIKPLSIEGLPGIALSPFIHGDWNHLMANTIPVLVLVAALVYFYKSIAYKALIYTTLITGFWVWVGAREATHIGASGMIYGLASFLMLSGFLRRESRLMALSLIVVFLYGSFIWGIFPELFPEKNISWESHLSGLLTGIILGFYFKDEGPQRPKYSWEADDDKTAEIDEPNAESQENEYWNTPEPDQKDLTVVYRTKTKQ